MTTLLLAFVLMLAVVAAMAVGVSMGRKPISGSCGGLAQLGVDGECEICGGNPSACDEGNRPNSSVQGSSVQDSSVSATSKQPIDAIDATRVR